MTDAQPDKLVVTQEAIAHAKALWRPFGDASGYYFNCREDGLVAQAFQRAMNQAAADEREAMRTVFLPAILHGDETHRAWLTAAVDAYLAGEPVPPPTGKGTAIRERTT